MAVKAYRDFVLVANEVEKDVSGIHRFTVQVFSSPAGEGEPRSKSVPPDLLLRLGRLERRRLDNHRDSGTDIWAIEHGYVSITPLYGHYLDKISARVQNGLGADLLQQVDNSWK